MYVISHGFWGCFLLGCSMYLFFSQYGPGTPVLGYGSEKKNFQVRRHVVKGYTTTITTNSSTRQEQEQQQEQQRQQQQQEEQQQQRNVSQGNYVKSHYVIPNTRRQSRVNARSPDDQTCGMTQLRNSGEPFQR